MSEFSFDPKPGSSRDDGPVALVKSIRFELTALQGKVSELLRMLGDLGLEEKPAPVCPVPGCGYRPAMNLPSIREHLEQAHPAEVVICLETTAGQSSRVPW